MPNDPSRDKITQDQIVGLIIDRLVAAGCRQVVASPGYRNAPLVAAAYAHPGCSVVSVLDERSAGFMALGICQTGQPAMVISTSGSAPGHCYPAVLEAFRRGLPLAIVTADRPIELQRAYASQTVSQSQLFGDHVVWRDELSVPAGIDDDFHGSLGARIDLAGSHLSRGPVAINCRLRKPLLSVPDFTVSRRHPRTVAVTKRSLAWNADSISQPLHEPLSAATGLVIAGPEIADASARERHPAHRESGGITVADFARMLSWPIVADIGSRARPGERPGSNGLLEALAEPPEVDTLLWFGGRPVSAGFERIVSRARHVVHVDRQTDRERHPSTTHAIAMSPGEFIEGYCRQRRDDTISEVDNLDARRHHLGKWNALATQADAVIADRMMDWSSATIFNTAVAASRATHIWLGPSLILRYADSFGFIPDHKRVHGNRGLHGIDGGVATAVGIAHATRSRVLAIMGDATFCHDMSSLAYASPGTATVVVVDNAGGRIFERLAGLSQAASESPGLQNHLVDRPDVDFRSLARAYACGYTEVGSASELRGALEVADNSAKNAIVRATVSAHSDREWHSQTLEMLRNLAGSRPLD